MNLLNAALARIVPQDADWRAKAKARLDQLVMPHWALGRLMDLAVDLAGISRSLTPAVARKTIIAMAGDHGVAAEGVSKYPQEVTAQMVLGFVHGMAGINALARLAGARVIVVDMGVAADLSPLAEAGKIVNKKVAHGTGNIAVGPAMTRQQAIQSLEAGIEVVEAEIARGMDIVGVGEMGIGNSTPAAAIAAALTGASATQVVGRGSGVDDAGLARKILAVQRALSVNRADPLDGLDVLSKLGGFEIGGMAGVMLGAAARRRPVVVDGFISTAAAMVAVAIAPQVRPYLIAAHRSQEPGHQAMLTWLGLTPLVDLDMRLGEGTGAAIGIFLVEAACKILNEMATFAEAGVSDRQSP